MSRQLKNLLWALTGALGLLALLLLPTLMSERAIAVSLDPKEPTTVAAQTSLPWATLPPQLTPIPIPPSPSPLPGATLTPFTPDVLSPSQEEDEQPFTQAFPIATLAPTPLPQAGEDKLDLLPLDWLGLLRPSDARAIGDYPEAAERHADADAALPASYYIDPSDDSLLVARFQPAPLAQQKLYAGLIDNLSADPIYVSDQAVIDQLLDLPLTAAFYGQRGGRADLSGTLDQFMTLHVLKQASVLGGSYLQPEDYLRLRQGVVDQAKATVLADPEDALKKSIGLLEGLLWDEKPWQLTVMGAQPYHCEADWMFHVAGHHLRAVDMVSGLVYTLTTDLLSSKVIGVATEGATPWLARYAALLQKARTALHPADGTDAARIIAQALPLMERLSGLDDLSDIGSWEHKAVFLYAPQWQKGYWQVTVQPVDSIARTLDSQGNLVRVLRLDLEEDLSLRAWEQYLVGYDSYGARSVKDGVTLDLDLDQVARLEGMDKDWLAATQYVDEHLPDFERHTLELIAATWQPVTLQSGGWLLFGRYEGKGADEKELLLHLKVKDAQGQIFNVEVNIGLDYGIFIQKLDKEFQVPEGAEALQG